MRVACIYFKESVPIQDFAESCFSLSPQICLRKSEAVFMEIGRCKTLYSESEFLTKISQILLSLGIQADVAIRDSVTQALIAAKFKTNELQKIPISALPLYSDPYGFANEDENIAKIEVVLKKVAITNLAEFSSLSESQISTRFGKLGIYWKRQIENSNDLPWPKWSPRENIQELILLSHEDACGSLDPLLFQAKVALDRLFDRIKKRGLRLVKLKISLTLEAFTTVKRKSRAWLFEFAFPQESTKAVLPILRERFDKDFQKDPLEALVLEIKFEVIEMIEGFEGQNNFIDQSREISVNHEAVLSQLYEKNGADKVYKASLKNRRLPEFAWEKSKVAQVYDLELLKRLPKRPTEGFERPLPIRISNDKLFFRNNRAFTITGWSEVEKIKDQWLDGMTERDYYKVLIEGEPPFWIFKDSQGEYFLHGWFR